MSLKIYKLVRKTHKWASIGFGVFLVIWLITGIVYVLPVSVLKRIDRLIVAEKNIKSRRTEPGSTSVKFMLSQAEFRNIKVSIPEAISILETELASTMQIARCSVYKTSNKLVYEITLKDGKKHLVDAIEGQPVKITEEDIKVNAIEAASSGSNIVDIAFLKERPYAYWGPIPTYRFTFNDKARTHVYVSPTTGQVELKNEGWNRLRGWFLSLHKFEFLNLLLQEDSFRKGVLLMLSLVGLAVGMTGFYLALPVKWLRRLP